MLTWHNRVALVSAKPVMYEVAAGLIARSPVIAEVELLLIADCARIT
ncbi:MAG TPA: hypothetical protein VIQ51_03075 [Chryseosolibacter sp.]